MAYPYSVSAPSLPGGALPQYKPFTSQFNQAKGFNFGSSMADILKGLSSSPLGKSFGGGGFASTGMNSEAYKKLLGMGNMSFGDWWSQIGSQMEGEYAQPLGILKSISTASNPSGMPVPSADLLAAPGLQTAESGARNLRASLMSAGGAGGNRSGLGDLASILPGQQLIGQGGAIRTQASLGAGELERERAGINANMKMSALGAWTGAVGQKAGIKAGALQGYTQLQQNAVEAAMQALIQLLGLDASQMPQFSIQSSGSPFQPDQFSVSGPMGKGLGLAA